MRRTLMKSAVENNSVNNMGLSLMKKLFRLMLLTIILLIFPKGSLLAQSKNSAEILQEISGATARVASQL